MSDYVRQRLAEISGDAPVKNVLPPRSITQRQKAILDRMILSHGKREIYEGSVGAQRNNVGSGRYYLTYSGDDNIGEINEADVKALFQIGAIVKKWPDAPEVNMYRLAT